MTKVNKKSKKFSIMKKNITIIIVVLAVYWILGIFTSLHLSIIAFWGVPVMILGLLTLLFLYYLLDKRYSVDGR